MSGNWCVVSRFKAREAVDANLMIINDGSIMTMKNIASDWVELMKALPRLGDLRESMEGTTG